MQITLQAGNLHHVYSDCSAVTAGAIYYEDTQKKPRLPVN